MSVEVLNYVEEEFGPAEFVWHRDKEGELLRVAVAKFNDVPMKNCSTFVTLGLSHTPLHQETGKDIRQELLMHAFEYDDLSIAALLSVLAEQIKEKQQALKNRSVITISEPIANKSAFYVTSPRYLSKEFGVNSATTPITLFVWCIPITDEEKEFVSRYGPEAFEDLLEKKDPDLTIISRNSIC
jgi:hypothetical protein